MLNILIDFLILVLTVSLIMLCIAGIAFYLMCIAYRRMHSKGKVHDERHERLSKAVEEAGLDDQE